MSVIQGLIGSTLRRVNRVLVASLLLSLLNDLEFNNLEFWKLVSLPPRITVKMERKARSDHSRLL